MFYSYNYNSIFLHIKSKQDNSKFRPTKYLKDGMILKDNHTKQQLLINCSFIFMVNYYIAAKPRPLDRLF